MSTTAIINTREITDNAKSGVLKYVVLGTSVTPSHREFFSFPPAEISLEKTQLHDYHKSPNIVKGAAGLGAHGFRVVQHQSALSSDQWFTDSQAEDIYLPEVEALVKMLTGAKQTIVINASFRRKLATEGHEKCYKRPGEGNLNLKALMREKPSVNGNPADALEPFTYRIPSASVLDGECIAESYMLKPSHRRLRQRGKPRWCRLPEYKLEEVLVIKLADSRAGWVGEHGRNVVGSMAHGNPAMRETEGMEPRDSIKVMAVALW